MIQRWSRFSVGCLLGTLAFACRPGSVTPARQASHLRRPDPTAPLPQSSSSSDSDRFARKPDGVAVDPAMEMPPAEESGASDDGLIALRPPLGNEIARRLLASFFRAVVDEDLGALSELLMADATAAPPPRGSGGATSVGVGGGGG